MADNNESSKPSNSNSAPPYRPRSGEFGRGSTYNSNYSSSALMYPLDLFDNRKKYGDNYAVFYINVPEDTRFNDTTVEGIDWTDDTTSVRGALQSLGVSSGQVGAVMTAGGAIGGGLLTGNWGGAAKGALFGAGGAAAVSLAKGATDLSSPLRKNVRLKQTIALNIPNNLSTRYSVTYQDEDMLAQTAALNFASDIASFVTDSGNKQSFEEKLSKTGGGARDALAALALGATGNGFASAATGLTANPKKEQVFKGVDFRTFSFEYVFAPRNAAESIAVDNIIKAFKFHMHPEYKDANAYLFLYPSEFDIYYYQGEGENMNLHRHTSCVLTEMSVNYTPNGSFSTFESGAATQIQVSLMFKELAILTKQEIKDGF